MFKEKIYDKLKHWKHESNGKTALLIEGARRVGFQHSSINMPPDIKYPAARNISGQTIPF